MRKANVMPEKLVERLEKRFGRGEPIFMKDIMKSWSEYSESNVYKIIKTLCDNGILLKDTPGVYFLPKKTVWIEGEFSLDTMKIVERRYVSDKGKVFGYYSGFFLMNQAGFSNQVPNIREIVTTKETTSVRTVTINGFKVKLRRAKININDKNAPVMQLLEIFNRYEGPVTGYQRDNLISLTGGKVDPTLLAECAKCFPKRALENLKRSGMYEVLAQ